MPERSPKQTSENRSATWQILTGRGLACAGSERAASAMVAQARSGRFQARAMRTLSARMAAWSASGPRVSTPHSQKKAISPASPGLREVKKSSMESAAMARHIARRQ